MALYRSGVARPAENHVQLSVINLQDAGRGEHCVRMHVMVGRTDDLGAPRLAPTGELTDLHFGLGIERNAECFRVVRGLRVDALQVVEDGVSGGDFF